MEKLRLGTRSSMLAMWQAHEVQRLVQAQGVAVDIVKIETKGDKVLDRALSKIGSKGLFTEELEEQLISGQIDLVQHSAKDVQSSLPAGLELIAFTKREQAQDVLVSFDKSLRLSSQSNFVVGTSSTRRIALLKHLYPQVKTVDMRGNLQTRFKKLADGHADAMLLAYAGVERMGYSQHIVQHMDMQHFVPAVGQGSIAIEIASSLPQKLKDLIKKACNHHETEQCLLAERAYLKAMDGGCSVPVFAYAKLNEQQNICLQAGIISLDGSQQIIEEALGTEPEKLGKNLAEKILNNGGAEILRDIKSQLNT